MSRYISVLNFKGGTGKSSVTENLAYALTLRGHRVLVIDCDRQANASTTLLGDTVRPVTLTDVLKSDRMILREAIYEARPKLYVVPSDGDLETVVPFLLQKRAQFTTLRRQLAPLARDFAYVLIDHAGAYTAYMEAALLASTEMLVPCLLEPYAIQGLFTMFAKLAETLPDHEIKNSGIIPYAIDARPTMARLYLDELRKLFGDELILPPVRTDENVKKAQSVGLTVIEYAQKYKIASRASEDFIRLAAFLDETGEGT